MMSTQKSSLVPLFVLLAATLPLAPGARSQTAAAPGNYARVPKSWPHQAVRAPHGMVATDEELGSQAGVEPLKRGGNGVVDDVAVAFALAVVEPGAGNLGGGGFMLIRLAGGRTTFLDYRETAPGKATRDMYIGKDGKLDAEASVIGYRSVAVPGTVAGLALALKTCGSMKLADVMAPAILLAENGFPISERLAHEFEQERKDLQRFASSRRIFLNDGKMFQPGETLRQPELAATLKRIARKGATEFYSGQTARMLVDDMSRLDGLITLDDLSKYQPKIREVLQAKYESNGHAWEVLTSPPPSSGGVAIIEALNMLQSVPLKGWDDVESVHMVAEVMRRVFADRAAYLADPDYSNVPVAGLTDPCYAKEVSATIDSQRASSSKVIKAGNPYTCGVAANSAAVSQRLVSLGEGPHTTHFSVVDAAGNAIAPGHRPLSSMTPTILLRDGKLSFVTGSPGGPTIISATLLSVINWMRLGMDAQGAINAPRFHHQWLPDRILMEEDFPESTQKALEARGFAVKLRGHIGLVNAIGIDPKSGDRLGAADPRDKGSAVGY